MTNKFVKINKNYGIFVLFFCFMVFLYPPYDMYITNINEFWFSMSDFIWLIIVLVTVIYLSFCVLFFNISEENAYSICVILSYFSICLYVQGNFLNMDVGILNGKYIDYHLFTNRYWIDLIVWIILFFIVFILYNKKPLVSIKIFRFIACFLVIVLAVTGTVLFLNSDEINSNKEKRTYICSDEGLLKFGKNNIIVFLLDMYDSKYMDAIINEYPEIVDELDGFTYYNNYTGGYATTDYAMPFIQSATYWRNQDSSVYSYINSFDKLYFDDLIDKDYELNIYGPASIPDRLNGVVLNNKPARIVVRNKISYTLHILEMGWMKYFPNYFKRYFDNFYEELNNDKCIDSEYSEYVTDNIGVYNLIKNNTLEKENGNKFKWIYTNGAHHPYVNDENLNITDENWDNPINCAAGALKVVVSYLEKMKEAGVYDSSTVIIMADHGYYWDDGLNMFTKPVMLIKPQNKKGIMNICSSPVSQIDYVATVMDVISGNKINKYGRSILDYKEDEIRTDRLFYYYYFHERDPITSNRRLIEFSIDSDSNAIDAYKLSGNEYTVNGTLINHFDYCETCKENNGNPIHVKSSDYPDE